jgi:S1-C subfamily serine protease
MAAALTQTVAAQAAATTPLTAGTPKPGPAVSNSKATVRGTTSVTVAVAIVGENASIKPIPLLELKLIPSDGRSAEPVIVRTGLDGTATAAVPVGTYVVSNSAPVVVDGKQYNWTVPLDAAAAGAGRLELTNLNARYETAASAPVRARQMAPEMEVYRQVRSGVFRIESGLSQGSGFLVDSSGFILTNAHVVAGQTSAAAVLDSTHRIALQIVYRDNDADVAVLRAAAAAVRGRPVLPLAASDSTVEPGERVFAIGYPLNQEQTLTSGIVSSVRAGAIISDVNINHGNSGGPMLNLAGEVVAINTFGDFTTQGGPGISGAIVISRAAGPLSEARAMSGQLAAPDSGFLPSMPRDGFRTEDLKAFADSVVLNRPRSSYGFLPPAFAALDSIGVGAFFLTITTPPVFYVRAKAFELAIAKDRKRREERAGMDAEARFSEMRDFRDWSAYVGDQRAPVVAFTVEPKVGETGGSMFRRLLLTGLNGKTTLRYSGDLESAIVFRNGEPVDVLKGGTTPVKQFVDNRWVDLKDVANYGYYVLPAEAFAPEPDGTPPSIVVYLRDLKNPAFPGCRELSREVTATVWNNFSMYYAMSGKDFVPADPKMRSTGPKKSDVCRDAGAISTGADSPGQ